MTVVLNRVELYRDAADEWRWRAISTNHVDVVATSGEGYKNREDCRAMAEALFPDTEIKDD